MSAPKLILASQSKHRAALLRQLGVAFAVHPADVDESVTKNESPKAYNKRVALAKAVKVANQNPGHVILAADTCVYLGRHILQTPHTREEAAQHLRLQSGRRVYILSTSVVVTATGKTLSHTEISWVKFKRFTESDIQGYLNLNTWHAAGAMQIEHIEPLIISTHGSISGIVGLPLYQVGKLLARAGVALHPFTQADEKAA